jgi:hypothetical protein
VSNYLAFWKPIEFAGDSFKFKKCRQFFLSSLNETLSVVVMRVCNPNCSPVGINRCDATPAPTGFAEIVGDGSPNASCYVERGSFP